MTRRASASGRSVLIVDDDPATVGVAARVVRDVGGRPRSARTLASALAIAVEDPPAVTLASLDLDGGTLALDVCHALRPRGLGQVIFLGRFLSQAHVAAITACNPEGFLCTPLRYEQLDAALRIALARPSAGPDDRAAPEANLARAIRQIAAVVNGTGVLSLERGATRPAESALATLRPREQEVVRLLFANHRVPAIAAQLGISQDTVRNHLKRVFLNLGVHSQQELIARLSSMHEAELGEPA